MISLVIFNGCSGIPKPVGDVCGVNAHGKKLRCYYMHQDFDDDGKRKPNAKPHEKKITGLTDLNGGVYFDPDSWAEVQIFIGRMRDKLKECQ